MMTTASTRTIFRICLVASALCFAVVTAVHGDNVITVQDEKGMTQGNGHHFDFLSDAKVEFYVQGVGNNRGKNKDVEDDDPEYYYAGGGGNKNKGGRKKGKNKGERVPKHSDSNPNKVGKEHDGGASEEYEDDEEVYYSEEEEAEEKLPGHKGGGGGKDNKYKNNKNKMKGGKKDDDYDYDDDDDEKGSDKDDKEDKKDDKKGSGGGSGGSGGGGSGAQSERRTLPAFSLRYTYASNDKPDNTDYNKLSETTTAFLDAYFDEVFADEPAIHAYTEVDAFRALEMDLVEFEVSSHFFLPGLVPRVSFLTEKFEACFRSGSSCIDMYLADLKKLDSSNPFSTTTSVRLVDSPVGNKLEGGLKPIVKIQDAPKKDITTFLVALLVGVGSAVLGLVLYMWVCRKKKPRQGKTLDGDDGSVSRRRSNQNNDDGTMPSDSPFVSAYYGGGDEETPFTNSPLVQRNLREQVIPEELEEVSLDEPRVGGIGNIRLSKFRTTGSIASQRSDETASLVIPSLRKNDESDSDDDSACVESPTSSIYKSTSSDDGMKLDHQGQRQPDTDEDDPAVDKESTEDPSDSTSQAFGTNASLSREGSGSEPSRMPELPAQTLPDSNESKSNASKGGNQRTIPPAAEQVMKKGKISSNNRQGLGSQNVRQTKLDSSSLAMGIIGDTFYNYLHMDENDSDEEDLRGDV